MSYSLGVDLGTTFVAAALAAGSRIEMFTLGDRSVVSPAVVYVREDGVLVTGDAAGLRGVSDPDRVGREFKRRLGNPTPVVLGGRPHSVTVLLGTLLRDVVQRVVEIEGEPPDRVLLTHPANWGPFRRALFEEVPTYAGLEDPLMVTEPEAAAAHYAASRQLADGEIMAVYDLGGGTFDATVLRKTPGGVEILGTPEGIERLGGVDFDEAILSYVDYAAGGVLHELDMGDPQTMVALARLRQDCVAAKEALSVDTETILPVFLPGRHFDVHLTRSDFEDMVRAPIESTIGALSRTLESAQVDPAELSAVLLVGGSSRIPLVAQMVSAELGRPTVVDTHPKYAVALGAATLVAQAPPTTTSPVARNGRHAGRLATAGQPGNHDAGWGGGPSQLSVPVAPDSTCPDGSASGDRWQSGRTRLTGLPSSPCSPDRKRRWQALNSTGTWLALVGVVLILALFFSVNPIRGPSSSGVDPAISFAPPSASADVTAVPIPAVGATIPVGRTPVFVAASPSGRQVYVANGNEQIVTVVDTAINKVTAIIPIPGGPPQFLEFTPKGRRLYVTIFNDQRTIHEIAVIDTTSNTVIATIPQEARPFQPAVSPDGKQLYVPNHDTGSVLVVSTRDYKEITRIGVPPNPHWVAFSREGDRAYTANHESNVISVIDTATHQVLTTVPVGTSPHSIAVSPTRPLVACANFDSNDITMIDTGTLKVVETIPVGKKPRDIIWSTDGRFAYAVNEDAHNISVIDAATFKVTATIPVGAEPISIAVLPNGRQAYVSSKKAGTLTILELAG